MNNLELYIIGRKLEKAGWKWETWSGSFTDGNAKGWWIFPNSDDPIKAMRRGDPKSYDQATISTNELYIEQEQGCPCGKSAIAFAIINFSECWLCDDCLEIQFPPED